MNQEILDYKYKERPPLETVQIIKDFFEKRGFTLDLEYECTSEANTHSCHIKLYFEDDFIMLSNGKGVTKELALASGYAEMYERFCNGMKSFTQKNFYHKIKEVCFKNFGYKIHPEEKVMTCDEVLEEPFVKKYYSEVFSNNIDYVKKFLNNISNNEFIGLPYKNIINNTIKYLDPQIILRFNNSTGMCAGNTFEEAFNEGFSEVLERYTYIDLIASNGLESYKCINIDKLDNPILREKAKNIQKAGYDFYLVDLSYDYGTPVVMGLLVNKKDHFARINFGSFPVFEIAAMRTITEVYQNVVSFTRERDLLQIPSENDFNPGVFYINYATGLAKAAYVPPYFFERKEYVDTYNRDFYLDSHSTPKEAYQYYLNFIAENDLNVWVINNSLMSELCSLHIFVDNLQHYYPLNYIVDYEDVNYDNIFKKEEIQKKYEFMAYDENPDFSTINYNDVMLLDGNSDCNDLIYAILSYSQTIYPLEIAIEPLTTIIKDQSNLDDSQIVSKYNFSMLFPDIKKYYTIKRYVNAGYSYKELALILKEFGIEDLTKEDCENINDNNYILKKCLIEPCWKYYHSKKFENICKALVQK